ncbi:hypothetical protein ACY2DA_01040 [Staphylococcus simulans]
MRNSIKLVITILLSFILLAGCKNTDKHFIVGKWESKDGLSYTFNSNNTVDCKQNKKKATFPYKVIDSKYDKKVVVQITDDNSQFEMYFGIVNPNKIVTEEVKMYDTDGVLMAETENKETGTILHRVK